MSRLLTFLLLLLMWAAPLPPTQAQDLKTVSFLPQWVPQAQFAGYYVAFEKGFYRERGLNVKILRGGPDFPPSELLPTGQVDFGTMFLTTGIAKRAHGFKLINIAQIVQRSALMLVAKKSSGIRVPADLQGKKVGLWGPEFQILPRAFFHQYQLTVKPVPQGATMNLFLRGGVEAASAMWYNEYHQILAAGLDPEDLTTFLLSDYGLKCPEDGIYCLEQTFKKDPDTCVAFVQASIQGWKYAFAHPEEALDIVMKYVNAAQVATNRVHQKWMLQRMQDIIQPPGADLLLGSLKEETYYQVARELKNNGLIQQIPPFSQFFIDCESEHEN
ncbi:MAG: ABC transporter substrate-binding protein [Thermodesulfobacteriota bacterium]